MREQPVRSAAADKQCLSPPSVFLLREAGSGHWLSSSLPPSLPPVCVCDVFFTSRAVNARAARPEYLTQYQGRGTETENSYEKKLQKKEKEKEEWSENCSFNA